MARFGFAYKFAVDEQTQQLGLRVFSDGGHKTMLVAPDAKIDGEQYASAVEAKAELDRLYPQEENMYWNDSEYGAFSMLFLTDETGRSHMSIRRKLVIGSRNIRLSRAGFMRHLRWGLIPVKTAGCTGNLLIKTSTSFM